VVRFPEQRFGVREMVLSVETALPSILPPMQLLPTRESLPVMEVKLPERPPLVLVLVSTPLLALIVPFLVLRKP
jgi:hypothetical protein